MGSERGDYPLRKGGGGLLRGRPGRLEIARGWKLDREVVGVVGDLETGEPTGSNEQREFVISGLSNP